MESINEQYPSGIKFISCFNFKKLFHYALIIGLILLTAISQFKLYTYTSKFEKSSSETSIVKADWLKEQLAVWEHQDIVTLSNVTNFKEFSLKLRRYKELFNHYRLSVIEPLTSDDTYGNWTILGEFEKSMFPWAQHYFSTLLQLKRSFNGGAGIVIPTGSHHFRMAVFLVRALRHLGCTLPICIAHGGDDDLTVAETFYLYSLNVMELDVSKYVDGKLLGGLKGWQIKPFAMLVAPFTEVIMMDADLVLLRNPQELLEDPEYRRTGTLIYKDRSVFDKDWKKTVWLEANLPAPLSDQVKASRMYQQISAHEQESGLVIINKDLGFFGLLAACKMNSKVERDLVTYREFYGDKESFWIGMEMAGELYTSTEERPGVIGQLKRFSEEKVKAERKDKRKGSGKLLKKYKDTKGDLVACGRILHFDRQGQPLWFNGGIVEDKRDEEKRQYLVRFSHYAHEGKWNFETSCLMDVPPMELCPNATRILQELGKLWRPKINLLKL